MTLDHSHLPHHYKGHPVPWVTRWTDEVVREPLAPVIDPRTSNVRLTYHDGVEFRDEYGVLWQREGLNRGGEPQFAQVSTYRQRAAVRKRLCQVCGNKIDTRPIRWVVPQGQLEIVSDGSAVTTTPPVCESCLELSLDICPFLDKTPPQIFKVLDYEIWGVQGEVVIFDGNALQHMSRIAIPYPQAHRRPLGLDGMLGQQQIVCFTKYVLES